MSFKDTIDKIVTENTKYRSVAEIPNFDDVTVESNSDVVMDLTIGKECPSQVSVTHYNEGTEDPLVMLEYPSFEPLYMRDVSVDTDDIEYIDEFLREWEANLKEQFL